MSRWFRAQLRLLALWLSREPAPPDDSAPVADADYYAACAHADAEALARPDPGSDEYTVADSWADCDASRARAHARAKSRADSMRRSRRLHSGGGG